ncbi:hypothetical protein [Aeromonas phage 14AhydR10PP]|nr:hypothetical protein [Aeromonas phage 14AhydR10PP]
MTDKTFLHGIEHILKTAMGELPEGVQLVTTVNGMTGEVRLTAQNVGAVPDTRMINGKELNKDIRLTAANVEAVPTSALEVGEGEVLKAGGATIKSVKERLATVEKQHTDDVKDLVPNARKVNNKPLTADVTLSAADVKARPDNWKPVIADVTNLETALAAKADKVDVPEQAPLPDVWAPLTSNLSLIHGFGSKVEFARTTAASYIDKSGNLKMAAINEPRFEKNGLLLEVQSTNLYTTSEFNGTNYYESNSATTDVVETQTKFGKAATLKLLALEASSRYIWRAGHADGMELGKTFTLSFWVFIDNPNVVSVAVGSNALINAAGGTRTVHPVQHNRWYRLTHTGVCETLSSTGFIWPYGPSGSTVDNLAIGDSIITVTASQCEALPYATSYIKTTGAQATRGRDECYIVKDLNSPDYHDDRTYAIEANVFGKSVSNYEFLFSDGRYPTRKHISLWDDGVLAANNDYIKANKRDVARLKGCYAACFDYDGGKVTLVDNGELIESTAPCTNNPANPEEIAGAKIEFGSAGNFGNQCSLHVRNFRIWHRALTKNQLKGIR